VSSIADLARPSEHERMPEPRLPRVAYVMGLDSSLKFGSLEEQVLILAQAFRDRGGSFVPVFAAPLGGEAAREFEAARLAVAAVDLHRFGLRRLADLIAILRHHQIDVVHWSFYHPLNPYVWALSVLQPRLRHLFTDHNSRWPGANARPGAVRAAIKNALFARYSRIVCVSDFVAASLRHEGVRNSLATCAHFVNTNRFRPDARARERVRNELGTGEMFTILFVGRLIEEKGAAVLLRAAAQLAPQIAIWIVGDGSEADRLKRLAEELSLEPRVRFLGDRGRVEPFMQAADCLASPVVWDEAAGLVNLEGLACGLPVVASRSGGIPEIVDHDRTGLLVERGDVEALANAIHRLFEDPSLRLRMSHEARRVALERYAPEKRLPDFLDLYRE